MGYYFFSEAAPQSDAKKQYILYIRKIEKHCAKKSDCCCNRRKTVLYFNKIKPIIIPKGSNVMKKIIAAVFIVIFSAMLLGGCSAPKIETEKIVSADEVDYLNARSYSDGLAAVKTDKGWGFIDTDGNFAIEPKFEAVGAFSEGLCSAIVSSGEKWGYIDKNGNTVIDGAYTAAAEFSDGFALVKEGNYYKFIDTKGNVLEVTVPAKTAEDGTVTETKTVTTFDDASSFADGFARVEIDDANAYINTKGEVIASGFLTSNDFSEGLCAVNFKVGDDDLNGYIGEDGKTVIEPKFFDTGSFSEGFAPYKEKISGGTTSAEGVSTGAVYLWGYINTKGETVISANYDNVYGFKNGLSRVSENVATTVYDYSFIDTNGKTVTKSLYRFAYDMTADGLARVARTEDQKTVWGFIDKNGAEFIELKYDNAKDFAEGFAPVCIGEKWGIIDTHGNLVVEAKFDGMETTADGHFLVKYGNKYGFLKIR